MWKHVENTHVGAHNSPLLGRAMGEGKGLAQKRLGDPNPPRSKLELWPGAGLQNLVSDKHSKSRQKSRQIIHRVGRS